MTQAHAGTVRVKAKHVRGGIAGDCYRCAVAAALQEATGDPEASVYERDGLLYLEVWGRHAVAPEEIRRFIWAIDDLDRDAGGRPVLPDALADNLAPFTFELPPPGAWRERCYGCEGLRETAELDDEGYCDECHDG